MQIINENDGSFTAKVKASELPKIYTRANTGDSNITFICIAVMCAAVAKKRKRNMEWALVSSGYDLEQSDFLKKVSEVIPFVTTPTGMQCTLDECTDEFGRKTLTQFKDSLYGDDVFGGMNNVLRDTRQYRDLRIGLIAYLAKYYPNLEFTFKINKFQRFY